MAYPDGRPGPRPVFAALLAVQVIFGIHYPVAKLILAEIEPRAWASMRVLTAAAILLVTARAAQRPFPGAPRDWARLAVFSIFGVVINQICFVEGLSRTTPTHSAIINTSIPVSTLAFAVLLGRERLDRRKLAALALALAGVLIVMRPQRAMLDDPATVGDLLTVVNATSFSLFLVLSRRLLTRTDPLAATAVLFALGSVGVLGFGWRQLADFRPAQVSATGWGLAAFAILFATVGTYLLNYWALARVDSSVVALFIYVQPLIAATLSAAWLGERPGWNVVVGGCSIFAGVYASLRPREVGTKGRAPRARRPYR